MMTFFCFSSSNVSLVAFFASIISFVPPKASRRDFQNRRKTLYGSVRCNSRLWGEKDRTACLPESAGELRSRPT